MFAAPDHAGTAPDGGFYGVSRALYLAFVHCHGGQWSREYRLQCRLGRRLRAAGVAVPEHESELELGERVVYRRACDALLSSAGGVR